MQTFIKNSSLQKRVRFLRSKGKTIGFCPTMGALHEGHLSLVENAQAECDITVVSIFVNPTQFNEKSDLDKYPRPVARDKSLLKQKGLDIVYIPSVKEIYPEGTLQKVDVDLGGLDQQLEGAFRPGHFEGVVQVVKRLLDIVQPDKLFMGQKDFQQFTIIHRMIMELDLNVELVVVPIKREKDGLAMSSRNVRLSPAFRKKSLVLNRMLYYAQKTIHNDSVEIIKKNAISQIENAGLKTEYFDVIDGFSLRSIEHVEDSSYLVAVVAAWAGDVRLIDNVILKKE